MAKSFIRTVREVLTDTVLFFGSKPPLAACAPDANNRFQEYDRCIVVGSTAHPLTSEYFVPDEHGVIVIQDGKDYTAISK